MSDIHQQVRATQKALFKQLAETQTRIFESLEKVAALNLKLTRAGLEEWRDKLHEATRAAHNPLGFAPSLFEGDFGKVLDYGRRLSEILGEAQKDLFNLGDFNVDEARQHVVAAFTGLTQPAGASAEKVSTPASAVKQEVDTPAIPVKQAAREPAVAPVQEPPKAPASGTRLEKAAIPAATINPVTKVKPAKTAPRTAPAKKTPARTAVASKTGTAAKAGTAAKPARKAPVRRMAAATEAKPASTPIATPIATSIVPIPAASVPATSTTASMPAISTAKSTTTPIPAASTAAAPAPAAKSAKPASAKLARAARKTPAPRKAPARKAGQADKRS